MTYFGLVFKFLANFTCFFKSYYNAITRNVQFFPSNTSFCTMYCFTNLYQNLHGFNNIYQVLIKFISFNQNLPVPFFPIFTKIYQVSVKIYMV